MSDKHLQGARPLKKVNTRIADVNIPISRRCRVGERRAAENAPDPRRLHRRHRIRWPAGAQHGDSAESVILSLALVIEARDAYTAVTASGSPGTPRLWVPR